MSYEVNGARIKGSELGRSYTARGLEKRNGLVYDIERDQTLAKALAERARSTAPIPEINRRIEARRGDRERERGMLSSGQQAIMRDVGRFRTILVNDLVRIQYGGERSAWQYDVKRSFRMASWKCAPL
jgi:hypothetical protein